jgi:hypothetical protein
VSKLPSHTCRPPSSDTCRPLHSTKYSCSIYYSTRCALHYCNIPAQHRTQTLCSNYNKYCSEKHVIKLSTNIAIMFSSTHCQYNPCSTGQDTHTALTVVTTVTTSPLPRLPLLHSYPSYYAIITMATAVPTELVHST